MRILLSTLFILFCIAPSLAQEGGANASLQKAKDYLQLSEDMYDISLDSFLHYRQLALPYFEQAGAWEAYVDCLNGIAHFHYQNEHREVFQSFAKQALDMAQKHLTDSSEIYGIAINNYGLAQKKMGKLQSALEYYEKALAVEKNRGGDKKSIAISYANIGVTLRKIGDYEEAVNYFNQSISLFGEVLGEQHPRTAFIRLSKGNCFRDMQQWTAALASYRKTIGVLEQNLEPRKKSVIKKLIQGYQNMSKIFLKLEQRDSVLHYMEKVKHWEKQGYDSQIINSYSIMGDWYSQGGQLSAALDQYRHALDSALVYYQSYSKDFTKAHNQMMVGASLFKLGKIDEALVAYQQALIHLSFDFSDPQLSENPMIEKMLSVRKGLEIIGKKAIAFSEKYHRDGDVEDLKMAHKHFLLSTQIVEAFRNDIYGESSKYRIAENMLPIFEGGIATSLALYQLSQNTDYLKAAFSFMEQNKAVLLLESLQASQALNSGNIPLEDLEKEKQLGIELNHWKKEINDYQRNKSGASPKEFQQWQNKYFQVQQSYKELIAGFEEKHPHYFNLKHDVQLATIESVRKNILDSETALLEYFIGDAQSYLFYLTLEDLQIFPIPQKEALVQNIQDLRQIISTPPNKNTFEKDLESLSKKSWQLSTQLIPPIIKQASCKVKRLIIVPDDILSYLPFEVLLRQAPPSQPTDFSPSTFSYLLNDFAISYNYSTTLLSHSFFPQKSQKLQPFLGFAPSFGDERAETGRTCTDEEVYTLLCNTEEVESIQQLLGGRAFLHAEANSRSFLEEAADYRIIHLATHACSDEQDFTANKIFFADDYLGNIDLQQLQLKAELAVLSACNTGSGKLIRGEGVMSLSRGFLLAGCPSTLMSLWSVDDCATSNIMIQYYQHLKEKQDKDQALRLAKIHHLQAADKTQAHPYFWAAFVQSGNAEALDFSDHWIAENYLGLGMGVGLLLLLFGYLFVRKK